MPELRFFLTEEAKKKNWESGSKTEIGLEEELNTVFAGSDLLSQIDVKDIPDGENEGQLRWIFKCLSDCIQPEDEIIFDITHSFRSLPMLAIVALNYAKTMKGCKLQGIYYGAYEAGDKDEEGNVTVAPIFDLTEYSRILEWTHAAETVREYGNPQDLYGLVRHDDTMARRSGDSVTLYIKKMNDLYLDLLSCRGGVPKESPKERSILSDYKLTEDLKESALQRLETSEKTEKGQEIPSHDFLIREILGAADSAYSSFNENLSDNYQVGLCAVKWYLDHSMVQQGLTAMEETVKTYLCYYFDLDEMDKDIRDIVDKCVKAISHKNESSISESMRSGMSYYEAILSNDKGLKGDPYGGHDKLKRKMKPDQMKEKCIQILSEIPEELADVVNDLKETRNDINHFGMNNGAGKPDKLKRKLEDSYEKVRAEIDLMNARKQSE